MGLNVSFSVPATEAEFNLNAKKDGACLAEAINNVIYRGSLAQFRDVFLHGQKADEANGVIAIAGVEDVTEIARKTKETGKKDKDGNVISVYAETEGDYFDRVCAEKGVEATHFQTLADQVAASIEFDASATERKPAGPKKLPATYLNTAKTVFDKNNVDKVIAKLLNESGTKVAFEEIPDGSTDAEVTAIRTRNIEKLGWGIKANEDAKRAAATAEYVV